MNLWENFIVVLLDVWTKRSITIASTNETGYRKYDVSPDGFKPTWIIIHHSWSVDSPARDWDGIRKYHMSFRYQGDIITEKEYEAYKNAGQTNGLERPWKDIAYHIGIEEVGGVLGIQKGRAIGTLGAHAIGFNDCSIGVCLVGNFDKEPPEENRLFLLGSVCRDFQRMFGIAKDHVIGHRDTFTIRCVPVEKSCPGTAFDLLKFRERLV
jgi:N-acetyl-anhydromuramyl-L-alanine amidase AmpD